MARKVEDLVGRTFGMLTVVSKGEVAADNRTRWLCKCECGNETTVRHGDLMAGKVQSCKCATRKYPEDISGMVFGEVTAITRLENRKFGKDQKGRAVWLCRCACGTEFEATHNNLVRGLINRCGKNYDCRVRANHIGKRYGKLTVKSLISLEDDDPNRSQKYLCICDCGKETEVRINALMGGQMSCKCSRQGENNHRYNAIGVVTASRWYRIQARAKADNIEFNVTREYVDYLWKKQKGVCALTGRQLTLEEYNGRATRNNTGSLDRIDSTKGYVEGNLQWIWADFNKSKLQWDERYFYGLCRDFVKHRPDLDDRPLNQEVVSQDIPQGPLTFPFGD